MATTIQTIELPKKARALDTSGNNNHGQIYSGRGLEFDGVTDYLDTGYIASAQGITNDITVVCWLRTTDVTASQFPFNFYTSTSDALGLKINSSTIYTYNDIDNAGADLYATTILNDTWYRVVVVIDSLQMKLYLNGVLVGSGSSTADGLDSFTSNLYMGNRKGSGGTSYFTGMMSNLQVWDTPWSADDVTYDYLNPEKLVLNNTSGTSLTNSNLKLWYPMQDGHRGQQSYILDGANTGLGDELVTNGDFDTDSDWSYNASYWNISGGTANALGVANGGFYQTVSVKSGKTYKVQISSTITSGNGIYAVVLGTNSIIFDNNTSEITTYLAASGDDVNITVQPGASAFSMSSVSVKAINDKNHATTVFYGDEIWDGVQGDDANWDVFDNNTKAEDASAVKITYVDNASGGYIFLSDAKDLNADLVVGRTYIISFSTKVNQGSIIWRCLTSGGGTNALATAINSTSFETRTMTVVADHATNLYIHSNAMTTGDIVWIKDISVKEVGVASGWTDADQQLHIPQTALQSYNEMAWFPGVDPGTDISAKISDHASIDDIWTNGGTCSAWVYIASDGAGTMGRIFDKSKWLLYCYSESGSTCKLAYGIEHVTTNGTGQTTNRVLTYGNWYHIVMAYNSNSGATAPLIYVNGESVAVTEDTESAGSVTTDNGDHLFIGNRSNGERTFDGTITEVSLWDEILTQAEVLELYNDGKAFDASTHSQQTALICYVRNNGLATWSDLSSNSNDAVPTNLTETMLLPAGVDATRDNQGFLMNKQKDTSSLNLPYGTESGLIPGYVEVNNSDTLKLTGSYTIGVWVKLTLIGDAYQRIVALETGGNGTNGYGMYVHTDGKVYNACNANSQTSASAQVTADTWTYITVTADGTDKKIYVNGVQTDTESNANDAAATTSNLFIGKSPGVTDRQANGVIDGALIYNSALDSTEVLRNYNATKGSHTN